MTFGTLRCDNKWQLSCPSETIITLSLTRNKYPSQFSPSLVHFTKCITVIALGYQRSLASYIVCTLTTKGLKFGHGAQRRRLEKSGARGPHTACRALSDDWRCWAIPLASTKVSQVKWCNDMGDRRDTFTVLFIHSFMHAFIFIIRTRQNKAHINIR